ncbi:D-2-hydroxyacid dehydrogenase [Vallitaleaceae bacterium 9-2]
MKIVLLDTDSLGYDLDYTSFHSLGEVITYKHTPQEEIVKRCYDADVLISNKIHYTQEILFALPNLKLICLTSTGTNTVDLSAADACGVCVSNIKGYSTQSVVLLTFAMLMYLLVPMSGYDDYVKRGSYIEDTKFSHYTMTWHELAGKTFGIVGLGAIGQEVAKIATTFGARIIYYSTTGKNDHKEYRRVDFDTLLQESDIISIHAPLTEATTNLFDSAAFRKMRPTAILMNFGRGPIVNEKELVEALNEGWIFRAGLDVLEEEPMKLHHPMQRLKDKNKLIITPHIAWASVESRNRMLNEVYQNIEAFFQGKPRNKVNNT